MSDIDEKLKHISLNPDEKYEAGDYYLSDDDIAQIKQVFSDAGYEPYETHAQQLHQHLKEVEAYIRERSMTGEEWYQRFEQELEAQKQYGDRVNYMWNTNTVLDAAKRAAGLDNDQKERVA